MRDHADGDVRLSGAYVFDRAGQRVDTFMCPQGQGVEATLLLEIVARQRAKLSQKTIDSRRSTLIRLEKCRVAREEITALARLRVQ